MQRGEMIYEGITKRVFEVIEPGELVTKLLTKDYEIVQILTSELKNEKRYIVCEEEYNSSYTNNPSNQLKNAVETSLNSFRAAFAKCKTSEDRKKVYYNFFNQGSKESVGSCQSMLNSNKELDNILKSIRLN